MCWLSCRERWITMKDSSEYGWQRSDFSRGLNSSAISDRNPRFVRARTIRYSSDASHDSGVSGRNGRDIVTDHLHSPAGSSGVCGDGIALHPVVRSLESNDISLRRWLDSQERTVDALECLHIFNQIVEVVNRAHSKGILLRNVRPSCFVLSSFNRVSFIESAPCSGSGSDSLEDVSNCQTAEFNSSASPLHHGLLRQECQMGTENSLLEINPTNAFQIASETSCSQSIALATKNVEQGEDKKDPFPLKQILLLESHWYTSPEEIVDCPCTCASDIYRLGILLFELFCTFSSTEEKSTTMSSLRHRILPPELLLKWPKEASFCLWLLHPEPSSRPTTGELLRSKFLEAAREDLEEHQAEIELRERIEDQELLLKFLLQVQQKKLEAANKLHEIVSFLSSDIEEVSKLQAVLKEKEGLDVDLGEGSASGPPSMNISENEDSVGLKSRKQRRLGLNHQKVEELDNLQDVNKNPRATAEIQESIVSRSSRLMKNFKKLESSYFLTRSRSMRSIAKPLTEHSPLNSDGPECIAVTESSVNTLSSKEQRNGGRQSGWINSFLEGLCKYFSYSKLKVKADLKRGDLISSSNLVCSLRFDRDEEFFATAGVNKKIKVFEYDTILNEDRGIHYPVVEMASCSQLSSICWNGYIKSQIASSNFEGVVQVWDVTRSQVFMEMREHERRVWSVDFSSADPTMLASGSDDCSVKLWNINQGASVCTIKTKANVCCVQFPFDSGRSLAFGSADHRIYYYDLRNTKIPLCTLIGHNKTVSYVKFIDSTNLVSASTDNTLKLWDLSMCPARVHDTPLQSFSGHMNIKNFVGLSVNDGYIATGSETNEVFIYHKAFPMPALSFKFNCADSLSWDKMDDSGQFVSSVCWRGQSSTLVVANSVGNIKILEMV